MSQKRSLSFISFLAFISLFLIACGVEQSSNDGSSNDMATEESWAEQDMADEAGGVSSDLVLGEKIIETISVTYETVDFDSSLEYVNEQIEAHEAALENSSRWQTSSNYSSRSDRVSMTIRVPNENLNAFRKALNDYRGLVIQHEDIDRTDVTRTYRDNETRINILKEEEEVLREMLQEQGSLEEILQIRTRLSEIVTERELFEVQNRDFDERIDYSTVYLELIQTNRANTTDGRGFWNRITDAFVDALYSFIAAAQNFVITLIYLFPYLVIFGIIAFVTGYIIRKRRKEKKK